jgi:hypothetical protein
MLGGIVLQAGLEFPEVGSSRKDLAATGDHDCTHFRIRVGRAERRSQIQNRARTERVASLGLVEH